MNTDDTDYDALFAKVAAASLPDVNAYIGKGRPGAVLCVEPSGNWKIHAQTWDCQLSLVAVPLPSTPFVSAADLQFAIASTFRSDAVAGVDAALGGGP
jgi:hypothetical protein